MQRRLLLDVVVAQRAAIFKLLAGKDQPLLIRRDALFVLNLSLNIKGDGLSGQRFHEDLHGTTFVNSSATS